MIQSNHRLPAQIHAISGLIYLSCGRRVEMSRGVRIVEVVACIQTEIISPSFDIY